MVLTPLTTYGHVDSASEKTNLNFWAERMLFSVLLISKSWSDSRA